MKYRVRYGVSIKRTGKPVDWMWAIAIETDNFNEAVDEFQDLEGYVEQVKLEVGYDC